MGTDNLTTFDHLSRDTDTPAEHLRAIDPDTALEAGLVSSAVVENLGNDQLVEMPDGQVGVMRVVDGTQNGVEETITFVTQGAPEGFSHSPVETESEFWVKFNKGDTE